MIQDAAMAVGHMNVDVVTDALKYSTDRIMGPKYMTAGLGDGGGCHPRDNIALRSFAEKHNFGYDLFDAIMKAREEQANNIAKHFEKIGVSKDMPCVVLGSGFKPGLDTSARRFTINSCWILSRRNLDIQSHMMSYLLCQQHICLAGQNTLMNTSLRQDQL
jgi:UDP-glucose 6-dehydrogenase